MMQNLDAPPLGANSACPDYPYQIVIQRDDQWFPVGACGDLKMGESQVAVLRRFMPKRLFTLSTGILTDSSITLAGNCRSCGGDGGWYEETDRGKKWVTCGLCGGSGSR